MNRITVKTGEVRFPVAKDLYGLFFEDINRSGDGGLYPEMLRNRSFEDSILPARCTFLPGGQNFVSPTGWKDQFNNGEGLLRWDPDRAPTDVPAWYTKDAAIALDKEDTLNAKREAALCIAFEANGTVYNTGFRGVPAEAGKSYRGYVFGRCSASSDCCASTDASAPVVLTVSLASKDLTKTYASTEITVGSEYEKLDFELTAAETDWEAVLAITAKDACTVKLGYSSLMPADTYKGHGLRKDLADLLAGTGSKFLRFPGGCIVEGFHKETAMRFPNTIGPEWERPSHLLMWHYRTSNGLGFHEYLQLCEDMNLEPLYVCNCGLTCQGRRGEPFEGEEIDEILQETIDAINYAIAPADTPMGAKRAANGHPEPFGMTYIEIGNEQLGEEYNVRYKYFYDALKKEFPQLHYISNIHTEESGLPTEIVDEHYYNTPEFFARNFGMYDNYDRQGPELFVGEYAVTCGEDVGNLRSAIAESMYLMGIENNQDIVKLTAYAPLFNHVHYTSWTPDLIAFDNHRSYGIPFYHALGMLAANRGENVVASAVEAERDCEKMIGLPGVTVSGDGVQFKNIKVNGETATPSHNIVSYLKEEDGVYTAWETDNTELMNSSGFRIMDTIRPLKTYVTFGEEEIRDTVFEMDLKIDNPDVKLGLCVWNHNNTMLHNQDETQHGKSKLWTPIHINRYVWNLEKGKAHFYSLTRSRSNWNGPVKDLAIPFGTWMKVRMEATDSVIRCYIDGELVHEQYLPDFSVLNAVATTTDDGLILKVANINDADTEINISLDCEVASDYERDLLTGDPKAENTLDDPNHVSCVTTKETGAAKEFVYCAPANSLSILKFKKA